MKANRKFVEGEDAVSAVIGVILMVAITVAIAATVYVYVSGMLGGGSDKNPTVSMVQSGSYITIQGVQDGPIPEGEASVAIVNITGAGSASATLVMADTDSNLDAEDTITITGATTADAPYTVSVIYKGNVVGTAKFSP